MRKILLLATVLLAIACERVAGPSFNDGLAAFVGTRSDAPLEETVWRHTTGAEYEQFVSFHHGEMGLFYGLMDAGQIQRWSPLYSAPYGFENGQIRANVIYPFFGEELQTRDISVKAVPGAYQIDVDGQLYDFAGPWTDDLNGKWITITVNIVPWSYE